MIDLHASTAGDLSAGIRAEHWTIENVGTLDHYDGQREEVRKTFQAAFDTLTGEHVTVRFSDEIE